MPFPGPAKPANYLKELLPQASSTSPQSQPSSKSDDEERVRKARVVFGSRLAGPAERRDERARASTIIAGVLVPPRPSEPDNCCMSGCVNCVWDRYRDELEEWAARSSEARAKLAAHRASGHALGGMTVDSDVLNRPGTSMDDDGGGSETNWTHSLGSPREGTDLFEGIPVGIREFMRTEKMLKERHKQETASRG